MSARFLLDKHAVGFSFNKQIVTDLLRNELGFDGIICSDWGILSATPWGVQHLSFGERSFQQGCTKRRKIFVDTLKQGLKCKNPLVEGYLAR